MKLIYLFLTFISFTGHSTGIVVDVGHSGTSIVPVFDGYILRENMRRSMMGGRELNWILGHLLAKENLRVHCLHISA